MWKNWCLDMYKSTVPLRKERDKRVRPLTEKEAVKIRLNLDLSGLKGLD